MRWESSCAAITHLSTIIEGSVLSLDRDISRGRIGCTWCARCYNDDRTGWCIIRIVATVSLDVLKAQLFSVIVFVQVVGEIVGFGPVRGRDSIVEATFFDTSIAGLIDEISNV